MAKNKSDTVLDAPIEMFKVMPNGKRVIFKAVTKQYYERLLSNNFRALTTIITKDEFLNKKFESLTVAELTDYSKQLGLKVNQKWSKAEIYNNIVKFYEGANI
jgi:hypothetical protein